MLFLLLACSDPLLTDTASVELGTRLCEIGHPNAKCGAGRRVDWSGGAWRNRDKKERWVDIAVPYTRKNGKEHRMVARVRLVQLDPCRVAVDVQADDGPNPILLDNAISSRLIGDAICAEVGL